MENVKAFLKKKNVEISVKRYLVDALEPWRRDCSPAC